MGNYSRRFARVGESLKGVAVKSLFFVFSPAEFEALWAGFFPAAPNQHHLIGACPGKLPNLGPSPLPGALPPIHSKTACRGVSERQWRSAANRPSRQARQVLLPYCQAFPSVRTCPQPFPSPPAPKTHPVSPFSGFPGCVFAFFAVLRVQNLPACFCASCRIVVIS